MLAGLMSQEPGPSLASRSQQSSLQAPAASKQNIPSLAGRKPQT